MKALKLVLILLAAILLSSCCTAQLVIVTQTTQNVTIQWDHSGLDSLGNPESMSHFNVWFSHNDGPVLVVGSVDSDTLEYTIVLPDTSGKYVLGVSAIDVAGNESAIHLSTDQTAAFEGWYLLFDIVVPAVPLGLIRIK